MPHKTHLIAIVSILFSVNLWAVEQLSDPTMPTHYKASRLANTSDLSLAVENYVWVLNSTMISPHLEVAIINGKQLKVGEEINGAILKRIDHQQVELSYEEKTITLILHHSFISQIKSSQKP